MSTSSQSFQHVRSILSKLDRDIEAARARRLSHPRDRHVPAAAPARAAATPEPVSPAPAREETGRSGYGIARPLRRDGE